MIARLLLSALSRSGAGASLSTLIFHRVRPDGVFVGKPGLDQHRFDVLLGWVTGTFNVLPPDEAVQELCEGRLPRRALCITFDDGYADNVEVALPVLRHRSLSAAFFIATDFLDGGMMWNDKLAFAVRNSPCTSLDLVDFGMGRCLLDSRPARNRLVSELNARLKYLSVGERAERVDEILSRSGVVLPTDWMMRSEQVRELRRAGMVIGGHTCSHPILASLPADEARREIVDGKRRLEAILGESISLFAYPNGQPGKDYGAEHADMVREAGFMAAFTTAWGVARQDTPAFQLPRFTPWDQDRQRYLFRLGRNMLTRATAV